MSIVLVTGGSGTLGRHLVSILSRRGHEVRVLSRRAGAGTHVGDLASGAGLATAGAGAELVVHAATDRRLGRTDQQQTANLLDAVPSCRHLVYISIVGVDAIPFRYYRTKIACEELITASPVPATVLRATQFHELVAMALRATSRLPVSPLPLDWLIQSVAAAEVAGRAADLVTGPPLGRAPDFGGPEVLNGWQLTAAWRARLGWPNSVLNVRVPCRVYRGFADGLNTCPDHADGRQKWSEFVATQ
ncbi:MAG: SDR family oxidoreductase [Streptosporangiaceae bacterium]